LQTDKEDEQVTPSLPLNEEIREEDGQICEVKNQKHLPNVSNALMQQVLIIVINIESKSGYCIVLKFDKFLPNSDLLIKSAHGCVLFFWVSLIASLTLCCGWSTCHFFCRRGR